MQIDGFATPANSSQQVKARLIVNNGREGTAILQYGDGREIGRGSMQAVTIEPRLGQVPRRLIFPDGSLFVTENQEAIAELEGPIASAKLHHLEAFSVRLVGFVLVGLAGLWLIWRFGLGVLVSIAVAMTPPNLVEVMDGSTMTTLDISITDPSELPEARRAELRRIFADLFETYNARQEEPGSFNLVFRSTQTLGPNALALPAGTIILTDELVEQFPDDDVIAAILGHEIGHVVEKHHLKQLYRSIGLYLAIALLVGDTGPILEDMLLE